MRTGEVVIHDKSTERWLRFSRPLQVFVTTKLDEVIPALKRVERFVNDEGLYAAGFISYEAAAAFDGALRTHEPGQFPLLWFGIYQSPDRFELPTPDYNAFSLDNLIPSLTESGYEKAISRIKQHIHSGNTYQVN